MDRIGRPFGTERPPVDSSQRKEGSPFLVEGSHERELQPGGRRRAKEAQAKAHGDERRQRLESRSARRSGRENGRADRGGARDVRQGARTERGAIARARGANGRPATPAQAAQNPAEPTPALLADRAQIPGAGAQELAGLARPEGAAVPSERLPLSNSGTGQGARPTAPPVPPSTSAAQAKGRPGAAETAGVESAADGLPAGRGGQRAGQQSPGVVQGPLDGKGEPAAGEKAGHAEPGRAEAQAPRWSETAQAEQAAAILRQFRMQLDPGRREATIFLSPPELGRVSIRLSVREHGLRAVVRAERRETLDVLEKHLPELRASLEQRGLDAQELDLGLAQFDSGGQRTAHDGSGRDALAPARADATGVPAAIDESRLARALVRDAGVDTYA